MTIKNNKENESLERWFSQLVSQKGHEVGVDFSAETFALVVNI